MPPWIRQRFLRIIQRLNTFLNYLENRVLTYILIAAIFCTGDQANSHVRIRNPQTEYSWGEEVFYDCEPGYVMRGPATRRCTQQHGLARLTGFNPLCEGR